MVSMVLQYYLPGSVNTGRLLISEIGYVRGIMAAANAVAAVSSLKMPGLALTYAAQTNPRQREHSEKAEFSNAIAFCPALL
jgi:hypothetical protein